MFRPFAFFIKLEIPTSDLEGGRDTGRGRHKISTPWDLCTREINIDIVINNKDRLINYGDPCRLEKRRTSESGPKRGDI